MTLLDQMETDFDALINTGDFAQSVVYTPSGGPAKPIDAIFDDEFSGLNTQTGQMETSKPQVMVRDSDVAGVTKKATVTVGVIVYKVIGINPDGTGLTTLILSKD